MYIELTPILTSHSIWVSSWGWERWGGGWWDEKNCVLISQVLKFNPQTFLFFSTFSHCQRLHKVLEDTRPQVWEVQDRTRILQKKGCYPKWPGQTVSKSQLLLRWMELHNQIQQKIQSTQKIRKNYDRCEKSNNQIIIFNAILLEVRYEQINR